MASSLDRIKILIAGISGIVLMIGVARFAYTPLLPIMQSQKVLFSDQGAWLASINYLGYLSGALIAASIKDLLLKDRLYRIGIGLGIVTTIGMALTTDTLLWSLLRYFAGLSSAAGLLIGSGLVLNWLMRHHFRNELGIHFSGIGLGIAVCSALVMLLPDSMIWTAQWIWFGLLALLLAIPAWGWLPRPPADYANGTTVTGQKLEEKPPSQAFMLTFMAYYFCAGVGYVVSATFIVAIVEQQPALQGLGNGAFLLLGLCGIPACILWDLVARRVGFLNALLLVSLLHTLSIALPLLSMSAMSALLSAALFGATFVGIVSLVLTMAGRFYPGYPAKMMGKMTFTYGIAQMAAPAVIGWMVGDDGGYLQGLTLASIAMMVGSLLVVILKWIPQPSDSPIHVRT
uniref:Putative permease of the major facilitator superfamily. MFS general substrate transporter n=1 Tax=Magnetococcus massalia (strain MO-1) TaxID=451514 RepID=A0A1S7LEH2_MAGMO|nr:Putative permease of the major facilitator superfamily. MFS general substrate transporter [Candidatus Magnetococcus massalia]